jgi:uncharacterized hydrophobic protein (TIGR00271 family)
MESRIPTPLLRVQDRLMNVLGGGLEHRAAIVEQMLVRDPKQAVAYWLQLGVSVGIATLGLALGSTAVVIAAMLVAPLMGPIIGLGMGLATGGPYLTLRAAVRVTLSVALVVAGSAAITLMLPFHELNAEIAARTIPTALDLLTAGFCALAGVYAAARPSSDTATTAAGTSIGISLVPPLCAAGFCYGTGQWSLGTGAMLLFLANMVAIVLVGTLGFVALGFNQVPIAELEAEDLDVDDHRSIVRPVARALARFYSWRAGGMLRVAMPFVLLALVYVPLRRALDEVTWQVRVRNEATAVLDGLDVEVVTSRMRVERHQVEASVVLIGRRGDAERVRALLDGELRRISGVAPSIEVRAVPDASAAATLQDVVPLTPLATNAPSVPPFAERMDDLHAEIRTAVSSRWPADAVGDPLAIDVEVTASDLGITVHHLGAPLEAAGTEVLERSLAEELDVAVTLMDAALPGTAVVADDTSAFVARIAPLVSSSRRFEAVRICVRAPPLPPTPLIDPPMDARGDDSAAADQRTAAGVAVSDPLRGAVTAMLAAHPRVTIMPGDAWALWFADRDCPAPTETPSAEANDGP